jgi:hypothetical protein
MDDKIAAIEAAIEAAFPETRIDYKNSDGMHSFHSVFRGAEKCISFEEDTFGGQNAGALVDLIDEYRVFESFRQTAGTVHLLISGHGVTRLRPAA